MKRKNLVTIVSLGLTISMMLSGCASDKKESSSKKAGRSAESETTDVTDGSDVENATSSTSESTVKSSVSSDSNETDQIDGTTESTVTASTVTSSSETPSESIDENSSAQPSEVTPISVSSLKAGDVITFGSFEQDNNTSNGAEDIEWIVASVEDGRVLLLSKYVLYSMPFNSAGDVAWEESDARNWLNGEFYEAAFDESERASIYEVELQTREPGYSRDITTKDKVFLLALADIGKYFDGMEYWDETYNVGTDCYELMTPATAYAEAHGAFNVTLNNKSAKKTITEHPELKGVVTCEWWLRETGAFCSIMGATLGNYYWQPGDILMNLYHPCDMKGTGIRPAIWVAIEE